MTIKTLTKAEGLITLVLGGLLDGAACPDFQAAVDAALAQEPSAIELDCTALEFVSSKALRILFTLHKTAAAKGTKLKFLHPADNLMEVFGLTGFDKIFAIER